MEMEWRKPRTTKSDIVKKFCEENGIGYIDISTPKLVRGTVAYEVFFDEFNWN